MALTENQQDLTFLSTQRYALSQLGIDLNTRNGRKLLKKPWILLILACFVVYMEIAFINLIVSNASYIAGSTAAMSIANQGYLGFIKTGVVLMKGDKFLKLLWNLNQLAKGAIGQESKKWLTYNRRAQFIAKTYLYTCLISLTFAVVLSILFMSYDYWQNKIFNKKLLFYSKYPVFKRAPLSPIYAYTVLNVTVGVDSVYGWCIYATSAHFRILRCKLKRVALELENGESSLFRRDISLIVCYHIRILKFVDDLNDIFGYILWAEVSFSCLQMSFTLYTFNNDDNVWNMPFNFLVLLAIIFQLMIYCYGGQKIKSESLDLCSDLYLYFPWHKMSSEQKKLMILPLLRSQKVAVLRGLFFEVDNVLLVYIMKTGFSYQALLTAMND